MRIKKLQKLIDDASEKIGAALPDFEEVFSEVESYYDSKSEKWQESEKGQEWYEVKSMLETAVEALQTANDNVPDLEAI